MITRNMPASTYFALPALSTSRLKEMRKSPQHFRYFYDNPRKTKPMALGTAAHCATLEPGRFTREFVIWDRKTDSGRSAPRNGKAWDAFVAESAGREILTADEYGAAVDISGAVRADSVAAKYLREGDPEVTLQWSLGDRPCKGRADWVTEMDGEPVLVGLKTAADNSHFKFAASAVGYGYTMQWAWYHDGYKALTLREPRMIEIVVEAKPPYSVVVYAISEDVLEHGRSEYQELLAKLGQCERDNYWPGPAETEVMLSLPSWAYGAEDDISGLDLEGLTDE